MISDDGHRIEDRFGILMQKEQTLPARAEILEFYLMTKRYARN